jgi:hypothetical protein
VTYNHLTSWLTDARNLTNPNTVIMLIGNKKVCNVTFVDVFCNYKHFINTHTKFVSHRMLRISVMLLMKRPLSLQRSTGWSFWRLPRKRVTMLRCERRLCLFRSFLIFLCLLFVSNPFEFRSFVVCRVKILALLIDVSVFSGGVP